MPIIELTSLQNPIVKEVVALGDKKNRQKSGLIILEGEKSVAGAIEAGLSLEAVFFENEKYEVEAKNKYRVNLKILEKISSTKSPAPLVALIREPIYNLEEFKTFKKIALFENIKDAGNLGTIIRSATAFGVDGIILYGDCVDIFSTKTIRASVGTIFKIPIITINKGIEAFKATHKLVSTVVNGNDAFFNNPLKTPVIVLFGSEADGLSNELLNLSDEKITIKMAKNVESLNLGVSAGIIFYEMFNF